MVNSLAQVVLKIGSPGVPDFYQGAELWDLSLVDPDNRRPVDFERRRRSAGRRRRPARDGRLVARWRDRELAGNWTDGRIKLLVTAAALRLRRATQRCFSGDGTCRCPLRFLCPQEP